MGLEENIETVSNECQLMPQHDFIIPTNSNNQERTNLRVYILGQRKVITSSPPTIPTGIASI